MTQYGNAEASICREESEWDNPYLIKIDGEDICVAEQFGNDRPEAWSQDLDGDSVPELICNAA